MLPFSCQGSPGEVQRQVEPPFPSGNEIEWVRTSLIPEPGKSRGRWGGKLLLRHCSNNVCDFALSSPFPEVGGAYQRAELTPLLGYNETELTPLLGHNETE